jgi:hypothetical protein
VIKRDDMETETHELGNTVAGKYHHDDGDSHYDDGEN